jgi:hypothetical protein
MRKNLFYFVAAAIIVCLSSCGNSDNDNSDAPDTPDGMVTLRLSTTLGQGSGSQTRSDELFPAHFSNDLGNGWTLQSTLTEDETLTTRTDPAIPQGIKVLMLAFASGTTDTPKGYELLTVETGGEATIELPKGKNFKLVFYSLNSATATQFKPSDYIDNLPATAGTNENVYYDLSANACTLKTTEIPVTITTGTGPDKIPTDAISACNDNVSTVSGFPSTLPVTFRHLFARLTWTLNVNSSVSETIGALSAGFYPRYATANLANLGAMTATTSGATPSFNGVWTGTTIQGTSDTYFYVPSTTSGPATTGALTNWFIPVESETNAQIHISKLSFAVQGVVTTVTDYDIPILNNKNAQISFEPGKSYRVTSNLTSTSTGQFAYSNVFWDGAGLNFYDKQGHLVRTNRGATYSATNDANTQRYQGMYFRWASLVAIDPSQDVTSPNVYIPNYEDGGYSTTAEVVSDYKDKNTPYCFQYQKIITTDGYTGDYATSEFANQYTPANTNYSGDVCAYITNGAWRLPTAADFVDASQWTEDGAETTSWKTKADGTAILPDGGLYVSFRGVFFPASGWYYNNSPTEILANVGSGGSYWSSTVNPDETNAYSYAMYFNSAIDGIQTQRTIAYRANARSVRCVKASVGLSITNPETGNTGTGTITQQ